MKFDTTAFKKASKRYADRHSIPLSEAQQAFSEVLGFKTTHDAIKRLEAPPPADPGDTCATPVAVVPAQDDNFCCGLNMAEFKMLFECLFTRTGSRSNAHSDSAHATQDDQARLLSRAVLGPIEFMGSAPMSVIEILNAFEMDALDKNYVLLFNRHGSGNIASWPPLDRPLARYMQSLHGYDTQRTNKRGGQNSDTRYYHLHRMTQLSRVFDLLLAIEAMGGAAACTDKRHSYNLHELLKNMIETRDHPYQKNTANIILMFAELAEMYPLPQVTQVTRMPRKAPSFTAEISVAGQFAE